MTKAGEQPTITQPVDVFAERKAFEAWWANWVPDGTMPSLTSHIFDTWLASARHRTTSLAAQVDALRQTRDALRKLQPALNVMAREIIDDIITDKIEKALP